MSGGVCWCGGWICCDDDDEALGCYCVNLSELRGLRLVVLAWPAAAATDYNY